MTVDPEREAGRIGRSLREAGDPERAEKERAYLKSDLRHLGASVPAIRKVARQFAREHPDLDRRGLVALVETLWAEPVHEHRMAAVELLDLYGDRLEALDLALVERLIRDARTWALVDGLAASVAGRLMERLPDVGAQLDRWAADPDFWVRRAALLTLLKPLRYGEGDFGRFAGYADAMLEEREFFIRKAIGWVLRETAKRRPALVHGWLLPRARRASGVTIREAVRHMPESLRAEILAAREGAAARTLGTGRGRG